jgi:hypothetical protein
MKKGTVTATTLHTKGEIQELPLPKRGAKKQRTQEFAEGELNAYLEVLSFLCRDKRDLWERMIFTKASARNLVFKQVRYLENELARTRKCLKVAERFNRQLELFTEPQ